MNAQKEREYAIWMFIGMFAVFVIWNVYFPIQSSRVWREGVEMIGKFLTWLGDQIPDTILFLGILFTLTIGLLLMVFVFLRGLYRTVVQ